MISPQSFAQPGFWAAFRRFDVERRLALVLTVLAIVAGIATYVVISSTPPYGAGVRTVLVLLNLDLILLLLLGMIVARRLVRLVVERRRGQAGSRLHTRLVALFGLVAATPAILVAIFSVVFLNTGLETWFSGRIRAALDNSLAVAEAYLAEHREVIRADALAMAADLNREGPQLLQNPSYLRHVVVAQAALRALTEAIVFDRDGRVLAHSGLGVALEVEQVPADALERAAAGEAVTLTSESDDRVRALLRLDGLEGLYLFVGRFVDPTVLGFMERTQRIVAEYRRMESERSGIQITSALIFAIVALLLLLAAVWVGMHFADQLATPISRLIAAANRVRSGDLLARVPEGVDQDELDQLNRAFNRMTSQLESQRRELVAANQQLDERRRFTEAVLAGVTAGVVGLDAERRIALPNRSAVRLLARKNQEIVGRRIDEALPEIVPLFGKLQSRHWEPVEEHIAVYRDGRPRTLLVRLAAQLDQGRVQGFVVTFDDITDLMSAQRQAAWAEVARRIAHEIKNPLTPIRLSAERLGRKFAAQIGEGDRESFGKSVDTIVQQVDTIGRLVSEFSAFARMPAPVLRPEPLAEIVKSAVFLQQTAWPQIAFTVELPEGDPLRLQLDAEKIGQVLTNLLQNSINALSECARDVTVAPPRVAVRAYRAEAAILLEIEDNGPGFPPGERERLFEPYVTTRAKGTGLGLAIVRKIMEEHGGRVELADGPAGGALARLSFPVQPDPMS